MSDVTDVKYPDDGVIGGGRTAYEAYSALVGGVAQATGLPMPTWDQLPVQTQVAWIHAAMAAYIYFNRGIGCLTTSDAPGTARHRGSSS